MDAEDERALSDLDSGRAVVVLNDGETWSNLRGCVVRISDADERWEQTPEFMPLGYRVLGLDLLVRHFLKTHKRGAT
jgi:hypothetical protein